MPTDKQIGEYIKKLRKKNKMLQSDLAKELNVTKDIISNWERGATKVPAEQCVKMADIFKISVDEILPTNKSLRTKRDLFSSLIKDFDKRNLLKRFNELNSFYQEFIDSMIDFCLEYQQETDEDILIAASGGENVSPEGMEKNKEMMEKLSKYGKL